MSTPIIILVRPIQTKSNGASEGVSDTEVIIAKDLKTAANFIKGKLVFAARNGASCHIFTPDEIEHLFRPTLDVAYADEVYEYMITTNITNI